MRWHQWPETLKGEGRLDLADRAGSNVDVHGIVCLINGTVYNKEIGIALLRAKSLLHLGHLMGYEQQQYEEHKPMKIEAIPDYLKKVARVIIV
eukprot:9857630-Karenia_brevis.AAC.1